MLPLGKTSNKWTFLYSPNANFKSCNKKLIYIYYYHIVLSSVIQYIAGYTEVKNE